MDFAMLTLASVQFPGGYLADKYGRKWLISTLTFGVAASYIFYALAPSWHYVLIAEVIRSLCLLYQPALNAMFADSIPAERRGMGFSILNLIMSVSTTPAPAVALLLVTTYGSMMGMRIAYVIVTVLFLIAATVRLKLKETMENAEKLNLKEALGSYPQALKEGINVWKTVPRSAFFLFIFSLLIRFAFTMVMPLMLVYAFYVLQIGGAPNPSLPPESDPALQLARERWGYVMIILFISMIIVSIPIGKLIDKLGRKIPLILSGLFTIPAVFLFIYGNYLTLFVTMVLYGLGQLLGFSAYQALFALLYDNIAPQAPFLLMPVLIAAAVFIIISGIHEPKPEERQE